jgi:hypothetical protein
MARDGRVDWRWRTGADVIGKPIADERYVYFVALDNVLRAMNLVTGGQQWMRPLPIRPVFGAVKAGSTIVVSGQTATVQRSTSRTASPPARSPALRPSRRRSGGRADQRPRLRRPLRRSPRRPGGRRTVRARASAHASPALLMLFKDVAKGASATLVTHSVEPALVTRCRQLPNLVQIAPVTPTTPPPGP